MITDNCFQTFQPENFEAAQTQLQNGDLLFCSGTGPVSQMIRTATNSTFSHVAVLVQMPVTGQWLVLESVESVGVRCVTLVDGYLNNYQGTGSGYAGRIMIGRHSGLEHNPQAAQNLFTQAFQLLGDQYSTHDVFQIASRLLLKQVGVQESGMVAENNRYICSEYVYACLKAASVNISYNPQGFISPSDIASLSEVTPVCQLAVNTANKSHQASHGVFDKSTV